MNNKGFTFIEMLATIAVLALIVAIAIPSYTGISTAIRKNQRKNIIDRIEIAASKYAFDTDKTIIFVEELITEGYIDSDDEEGNIVDPVNNERMNCYIVEMKKVSDYYNASFKDNKNYDKNGVCDTSKLQDSLNALNIQVLVDNKEVEYNKWVNGSIRLIAHSNNTFVIDCLKNECLWTSSSGQKLSGFDNYMFFSTDGIFDTTYTFQYTIYDDKDEVVKRYKKSVDLKVDYETPSIYDDQITVSDRYINTASKHVSIVASDGKGSGIAGYYLGKDIGQLCESTSIIDNYQDSNKFTVVENGSYLICVKDKVGNISSSRISISHIS